MAISDISDSLETLEPYRERYSHLSRTADMIRESLREAILDSQLAAGTWLREEELARYFGVSRTPVREALQILRSDGIVEAAPNHGSRVAALTTDDVLALYLVREVLDGLAARLATSRMTSEQWQELSAINDQMEIAAASNEPERVADLNLQFHQYLRQVAGNPYLSRFMKQVEHAIRRSSQTIFSYPGRSDNSVREHREICDAIQAGDSVTAEALAIEHVRRARRLKLQMLMEGF
ncbi:GntR family transcriptional regulator [soil metagenome]